MADARPRRKLLDRIPPLLRYVILVAICGPIIVPIYLYFDRSESVAEVVLDAMFTATWIMAAVLIGQEHGPGATRERDEETEALRHAVRKQTVPDDARLRAALPGHLSWLRQGAIRALVAGSLLFGGLAIFGLLGANDRVWALLFGAVLVVFVAVVGWNLSRLRRLAAGLGQTSTAGR